jgi:hypothetical protein
MIGESLGTLKTACISILGLTWFALAAPLLADSLGSVTVTAPKDQEQLKHDVDTFVSSAIVRSDGESLLRWDRKICPLVAGLSREAGEFVLARLSQIAMSAKAPLGSATCKPNLLVLVANNPESFLRLWWRRNPRLFNTGHGISPVKHFIETSRPVRVWYNAGMTGGENGSLFTGMLTESSVLSGLLWDYPVVTEPSFLGSRITYTTVRTIESAIVVVDSTQVSKLNIGQLTDYIGLIGLAEINLDKDLGEAPSILKVFAASEAAPQPLEMTVWDKALLQSLYATPQDNRLQLSKIKRETLKLIAAK